MKTLHRTLALLLWLVCLAPCGAVAQDVGTLHLHPLHLDFPAAWTFDGSKRPRSARSEKNNVARRDALGV